MSFRNSFADNYPVTALLLLLNIGFFVLQKLAAEKLYGLEVDPDMLLGKLDTRAAFSQPWRLISATYLHGGAVHLFFNLYALYYLAQIAEPLISRWKFFTVYTLCGIGGTMLHASWTLSKNAIFDMDTFTRALGASGAIVGLLGALLVYAHKERIYDLRDQMARPAWFLLSISAFLIVYEHWQNISGLFVGEPWDWNRVRYFGFPLDHAGHLGGFLTGALLGLTIPRFTTSEHAARWRIPAYIIGAVVATSLGFGLWRYFSYLIYES